MKLGLLFIALLFFSNCFTNDLSKRDLWIEDKTGLPFIYGGRVLVSKNKASYDAKMLEVNRGYLAIHERDNVAGGGQATAGESVNWINDLPQNIADLKQLEEQFSSESQCDLSNTSLWVCDDEIQKNIDNVIERNLSLNQVLFELKTKRGSEFLTNVYLYAVGPIGTVSTNTYYEFDAMNKVIDPIVYGNLDGLGMIPGIDFITDGLGVAYAAVRGNGENVLMYSAALATPFAGAIFYKGGKKILNLCVRKNSSNIYELAVKESFEDMADWYKVSNDVPVSDANAALAKTQLNSSSKLNDITQTERKVLYEVAEKNTKITPKTVEEIKHLLITNNGESFFWSGKTNGLGGEVKALEIAKIRGGITLEGLLKEKNIELPAWNPSDPSVMKLWEDVSAEYAKQVLGEVRAVIGLQLRPGNIWQTKELPALMNNTNVTKITTIDPETLFETVIFTR